MNHMHIFIVYGVIISFAGCLHATERVDLTARSMAYVLQADQLAHLREKAVEELASSGRDLIVLDCSYDAGTSGTWTETEIEHIRGGEPGRKVVCYLSIGEAEDYRSYWQKSWDTNADGKPDEGAPPFLNAVNPHWNGNYKVRYWHQEWQSIILKIVDEILAQGFDGVYLDIVDAFEFYEYNAETDEWQDNRMNPETGNTYRQDMTDWVKRIAAHGRASAPGFIVIPQNGAQLLSEPGYIEAIDAIGIEDLFTDGNRKQENEYVSYVLGYLAMAQNKALPILLIEYGTEQDIREYSAARARSNGFTLLLTDRHLTTLGVVPRY